MAAAVFPKGIIRKKTIEHAADCGATAQIRAEEKVLAMNLLMSLLILMTVY